MVSLCFIDPNAYRLRPSFTTNPTPLFAGSPPSFFTPHTPASGIRTSGTKGLRSVRVTRPSKLKSKCLRARVVAVVPRELRGVHYPPLGLGRPLVYAYNDVSLEP